MQMGEIPMLSRSEEIHAAKEIDKWRRSFRMSLMASDFVLHGAIVALEKVRDGELRLDRTIEVSVTNLVETYHSRLAASENAAVGALAAR